MVYLDNAATSFPKPYAVASEVRKCIRRYCGNPGRSGHRLSLLAAERIFDTRVAIADLLSYPHPERVIFTQNATHALNLAIKGLIREKCHVIISDLEHNSVVRPLKRLKDELGIEISVFDSDRPIYDSVIELIRPDTKFIISTTASNVTGKIIDLKGLSRISSEYGLYLILDASQSAGHGQIDISDINFAAVCSAGHKGLFGIQGSGFVIFSNNVNPTALLEGGSGNESRSPYMPDYLPEALEAGTLSTPSIVSLGAGIRYLNEYGLSCVEAYLATLTDDLVDRLESVGGTQIYGYGNGIVSFNLRDIPSEIVAQQLSKHGICVRSGLHCSPLAHKKLGTLECGTVRASMSIFNTRRDIDILYRELLRLTK